MKLNLACGKRTRSGYFNIDSCIQDSGGDYRDVQIDLRQDIRTLTFEENSIDEVYARQLIQYFNPDELKIELQKWYKWLKPGALLSLEVANLESIIDNIKKFIAGYDISGLNGPFGIGQLHGILQSHGHRWSWCTLQLYTILQEIGFRDIKFSEGTLEKHRDFCVSCVK